MRLEHAGAVLDLPPGWEARARRQDPSRPGRPGNLLLHAATVPLPEARGDFGSGVVDLLGPDDLFLSLLEYDAEDAGSALFEAQGLPLVAPSDFSPAVLQRTVAGQSGAQWFFTVSGRPFCLHAVLGSHGRRAPGAARLAALLGALTVAPAGPPAPPDAPAPAPAPDTEPPSQEPLSQEPLPQEPLPSGARPHGAAVLRDPTPSAGTPQEATP
jgi:hypothetical protein